MQTDNPYVPPAEDSQPSKPSRWGERRTSAIEILLIVVIILTLIGMFIPPVNKT